MPDASTWASEEFICIARGQAAWEDDLAMRANRLLICDTDPLATHIWHRRYCHEYSAAVERIVDSRQYDLYILTMPDFGFIQDGTREGEQIRLEMHQWFLEVLRQKQKPYILASGKHEQRMVIATTEIDRLLTFPILAVP